MRHVISVREFTPEFLEAIFALTAILKNDHANRFKKNESAVWNAWSQKLHGLVLISRFDEASERTQFSFASAAAQLGGIYLAGHQAMDYSSEVKGGSLEDSVRSLACYCDAMIVRHKKRGALAQMAAASPVPILNAGDGDGEHPTQALLDLFTILECFTNSKKLIVTLVGDLRAGRTVHSLSYLFALLKDSSMDVVEHINFVGPVSLQIPEDITGYLTERDLSYSRHFALTEDIVAGSDVVYMTRAQLERHGAKKVQITGAAYQFTDALARHLKEQAIILHPFPRNEELPTTIDLLPQAWYFKQIQNGLYVRMALLLWVFDKLEV